MFPCSDGDDLESAYSENHVKDLCIVRKPSSGVRAGLFAWGLTDDILPAVPLLCELDDTDGDGVYDDADLCPNTANPKGKKLWNGCSKFDLDADNDKVCDFSVGPNPFCSGLDNCPTVPNRLQTITPSSDAGDACNTGKVLGCLCVGGGGWFDASDLSSQTAATNLAHLAVIPSQWDARTSPGTHAECAQHLFSTGST